MALVRHPSGCLLWQASFFNCQAVKVNPTKILESNQANNRVYWNAIRGVKEFISIILCTAKDFFGRVEHNKSGA